MSYDDNNIFAKILRGEIPCKKIYEDDFKNFGYSFQKLVKKLKYDFLGKNY